MIRVAKTIINTKMTYSELTTSKKNYKQIHERDTHRLHQNKTSKSLSL